MHSPAPAVQARPGTPVAVSAVIRAQKDDHRSGPQPQQAAYDADRDPDRDDGDGSLHHDLRLARIAAVVFIVVVVIAVSVTSACESQNSFRCL